MRGKHVLSYFVSTLQPALCHCQPSARPEGARNPLMRVIPNFSVTMVLCAHRLSSGKNINAKVHALQVVFVTLIQSLAPSRPRSMVDMINFSTQW